MIADADDLERLDARLAGLAVSEAPLRLRLGQVFEMLSRGGHFELGFSSVGAYARERCERSIRWMEGARCLARRLEQLPQLRRAVAHGQISWSMAELVARVAEPVDEARWLDLAERHTVRQMRELVRGVASKSPGGGVNSSEQRADEAEREDDVDRCTLTCTIAQEEAWLWEATRALLNHMGARGSDAQIEALLVEGQAALLDALPPGTLDAEVWERVGQARERWRVELGRCRAAAEAQCEGGVRRWPRGAGTQQEPNAFQVAAAAGCGSLDDASGPELDGLVRSLSRALSRHELELAQLLLLFYRTLAGGGGLCRLGYATEAQYARERLGMSRSSMLARRALAARLEALPRVTEALGRAEIGVEAALQIVRVANARTEEAWVARARRRTIKHLQEEVAAALIAVRLSGEMSCPPPLDAEMEAFHELERAVVSGRAWQPRPANDAGPRCTKGAADLGEASAEGREAWFVMLGRLAQWLEGGVQMSAGARTGQASRAGRVVLRLRMPRTLYFWWRGLEAQARCWLPCGMSWLKFLCLAVWEAWRHMLGKDLAYGRIYVRDRFQCASPVCSRRDVTPHHLEYRSAGGGDEDDNVTAVCTWCHLFGVHGGRIRATGTARRICWELGARGEPCVVVHGRERVAA